jgi:hypothetical protein
MSDLAKAGLSTVVDLADNTTAAVSVAVRETVGAGTDTVAALAEFGGQTVEEALNEAEELRQNYIARIRKIVDAVAEVV